MRYMIFDRWGNPLGDLPYAIKAIRTRATDGTDTLDVTTIGEINKDLSTYRAEDGLLETRMRQLHGEIGRFVSRHAHNDPRCASAVRTHRALADVMRALRRSIALNHKLAGTS